MTTITSKGGVIAGTVGLSLVVLVGMVWWVRGEREAEPAAAPSRPGAERATGIAAAGQDSARRDDGAPAEPEAPRFILGRELPSSPPEIGAEEAAARDNYAALQAAVVRDVGPQLAARRAALRQRCWTPELTAGLEATDFKVLAGFDADGKMLDVAVEVPASAPGAREVGQCLRAQSLELSASAPGQAVTVELPLALP